MHVWTLEHKFAHTRKEEWDMNRTRDCGKEEKKVTLTRQLMWSQFTEEFLSGNRCMLIYYIFKIVYCLMTSTKCLHTQKSACTSSVLSFSIGNSYVFSFSHKSEGSSRLWDFKCRPYFPRIVWVVVFMKCLIIFFPVSESTCYFLFSIPM